MEELRENQLPTPPLSPKPWTDEETFRHLVTVEPSKTQVQRLSYQISSQNLRSCGNSTASPEPGLIVRAPVATRPQVSPSSCLPTMMNTPPPATAPMTIRQEEKSQAGNMYWNAQQFFHAYYPYGISFPSPFYPPHTLHRLSPTMPPHIMSLSPPHLSPTAVNPPQRLTPLRPEPIKYIDHQKENEIIPNVDDHVTTHVTEKAISRRQEVPRYQCSECNKSYSTFSGLSKHKQFHCVSQAKKSFSCKYCEKVYVSLGALKMHIRTHTLPCKCKLCGKAFSRPWLLQGHIRTHTGEKPFSCSLCHRSFADRSNLRAHLQTHSDVKKYCCKLCMKTFSRMSLLLKHEEGGCRVCPVRMETVSGH